MHAFELNAEITANHEIHLKLPNTINATVAKVIVLYENNGLSLNQYIKPQKTLFGMLQGQIEICGDIINPIDLEWDVMQ